jgi:hypothetical protein
MWNLYIQYEKELKIPNLKLQDYQYPKTSLSFLF